MVKVLFQRIFNKAEVAVSAERIRGNLSQGRTDRPGVWYKA